MPRPLLAGYGSVLDLTGAASLHQIFRRYDQDSVADALHRDWACVGSDYERAFLRLYRELDPSDAARVPDPQQLMLPLSDRGSTWFVSHGPDDSPHQSGAPAARPLHW